jgi:cobalt-zinc-cadmium efflux system membrane fusion protein
MKPQNPKTVSLGRRVANQARGRLHSIPLIAVAVAAGGLGVGLVGRSQPSSASLATPRAEHVTEAAYTTPVFSTTAEQWAAFSLAEVATSSFEAAKRTDGQIAIDDDLSTPVFSPYTGRVTRVIAKPGDVVKAGQPLFAIQASEFVQVQNDLIAAAATLRNAQAQLRMAQTTEARMHGLFGAQAGSQKDWQQSQLDLATAQGNMDAANIALAAVRGRLHILGKNDADIAALEQHPGTVKASPEVEVLAPIAGTIIQRQIGIGQYIVSASGGASNGPSTPVYTIGDLSKVWLVANVREVDTGLIHLGGAVSVRVPAFPERTFNARISYVAPSIDPATRSLAVRAEIDNSDNALKPAMFGSFTLVTGAATAAASVPERGVVREGPATYVWVANPADKTLEMRRVRAGRVSNGVAEITEGLHVGERVVTSGAVFIDRPIAAD